MTRTNCTQVTRDKRRALPVAAVVCATIAALGAAGPATAQLDRVVTAQAQVDRAAAQTQRDINATRDRIADAAQRYAQALADAESLEQYNQQLQAQVESQEEEIASIERQLAEIETTNREIQPLMEQMVDALAQFVELDVPFLLEERRNRVNNLKELLGRADVSISEKYRRILEAYQIELEYGRTLEAYEGILEDGSGEPRTVEFVQLGRVALLYQTLDGSETGYWDHQQKRWVVDNSYADEVENAIRIARQEVAPDLLIVPVPAPEEVRS
ncbi:MAG TPA: DUF3450 domain-containing protein [Gammaproteobacteria bacterium]